MATRKRAAKKTSRKSTRKPINGLVAASRDKKYKAAKKRAVDAVKAAAKAWKEAVRKQKSKTKKR